MQEWNIRPYQDAILEIFREFQRLCERYSLRYFAIGGTALGAVRHHGFIPWDDDMDVAMPREDYDVFVRIARSELPGYLRFGRGGDSEYAPIGYGQIINTKMGILETMRERTGLNITIPPFLDVFVLEGVPESVLDFKRWRREQALHRICQIYRHPESMPVPCGFGKRSMKKALARIIGALLSPFYPRTKSNEDMMLLLDAIMRKWSYGKSMSVVEPVFFRFKTNRIFPKTIFEPARSIPFEDGQICVPARVEEYLEQFFGDYMTLPPIEHRIPEHTFNRAYNHV